ncbi:MAG: hypothetical protein SF182_00555 [Deltaproteobacteria bacterium]|nr:hypothetical protein [Deltaproteobacteria bacterium]
MGRVRGALALMLLGLLSGAARADAPPTPAAQTPGAWPRTASANGATLVVAQPQLDTWANRVQLTSRAAAVFTPAGGTPVSGVLRLSADTNTDFDQRAVTLSNIQLAGVQFDGAPADVVSQVTALAKSMLPSGGVVLSLDNLLAALVASGQQATSVATLNTTPPTIYLAAQPSRLVQFDGAPSFAPIDGTTLQYAINTNWALIQDGGNYYLLDRTGWLTSDALSSGAWEYTDQLPQSFSQIPNTPEWTDVRASIPAPITDGQAPLQIFVATTPSELIVMVGEPQYQLVPGTGISTISNTDSLVFWDGYARAFYYLVAGRWFSAPALSGPWTFATGSLPADLVNIPADNPLAAILASVPGTQEAREAALESQIPHLATVSRKTASPTVTYNGAPQFAPVENTALTYAVNTPDDIVHVGDSYYLCQNGVWFVAGAPTGPWSVATSVPDAIYGIPPSSPLYNLTYVRVYDVDDDNVVYGYTGGYLGQYVADGVVTWGTGYYYPPYLVVGAAPYYYPRPFTYGADTFYNPATGRFARAAYGYGPYGGVAAAATYNPTTGVYTRRVVAGDSYESAGAVEAYNPRTATYAAGVARANPYASWDRGVVYGPSDAARAAQYSNDRGSVARVQTADGGEAVAVSDGDRSAAAVRAPGGDWYAGGDGNVYRHGDDGWQRYDGTPGMPVEGHPVESHPVPPGQYVPSHPVPPGHYVPSYPVNSGLDQSYYARQRQMQLYQQRASWGQRDFSGFGGGRYAGGGFRGGGRR